jgi:hypothetical protein
VIDAAGKVGVFVVDANPERVRGRMRQGGLLILTATKGVFCPVPSTVMALTRRAARY